VNTNLYLAKGWWKPAHKTGLKRHRGATCLAISGVTIERFLENGDQAIAAVVRTDEI